MLNHCSAQHNSCTQWAKNTEPMQFLLPTKQFQTEIKLSILLTCEEKLFHSDTVLQTDKQKLQYSLSLYICNYTVSQKTGPQF